MNATTEMHDSDRRAGSGSLREQVLARIPATERRVDLAGVPTAVLEGGEGPPIVLLHGSGELAATWMRVIPDLARTHRVVVPDLPGHGASGVPTEGPLGDERMRSWLDELIRRTCAAPPVLVGHLLGGAIAARFAATRSDRIAGLVLVDSYGLSWFRPSPRFAFAMVRFIARPTEQTRDGLFQQCFVDLDGLRQETDGDLDVLGAYALECARRPEQRTALRSLMPRVGVPPIATDDLEAISVPTAMIWGREDLQVRLEVAEAANARYGWPLHVVDGAADDPPYEQPAAFLRVLRTELDTMTREVAS